MSKLNSFISFFLVALFIGCTTEPPRDILTRTVVYEPTEKWMWLHGDKNASEEDLKARFTKLAQYGVTGVLIGGDHEPMFRSAKAAGIEAHIWMWTLNRGDEYIMENHPEWYSENRLGVSCWDDPPYVGYYRWLCPTKVKVSDYLAEQVTALAEKEYIDGIHLDYVRYCDVILPRALWEKYGLVQDRELPQFDYCYCSTCRKKYEASHGTDPILLAEPSVDSSWIQFRHDQVTALVNRLSAICQERNKPISAAVFPTPSIAKQLVRQDWVNWKVDRLFPMVYHGFYNEPADWIETAVKEGVDALNGKCKLTAGVYMPDLSSDSTFNLALKKAKTGGSMGISIFGKMSERQFEILKAHE